MRLNTNKLKERAYWNSNSYGWSIKIEKWALRTFVVSLGMLIPVIVPLPICVYLASKIKNPIRITTGCLDWLIVMRNMLTKWYVQLRVLIKKIGLRALYQATNIKRNIGNGQTELFVLIQNIIIN